MAKQSADKGPIVRNTYLLVIIMALLGAFIALNYLVFIPRQEAAFNKKAFRIMHKMADDFGTQINAYADFYKKSNGEIAQATNDSNAGSRSLENAITSPGISSSLLDTCFIYFGSDSVVFRPHRDTESSRSNDSLKLKKKANDKGVIVSDTIIKTVFRSRDKNETNVVRTYKKYNSPPSETEIADPFSKGYKHEEVDHYKSINDLIQPIQAIHQQLFDYLLLINKEPATDPATGRKWRDKLLYKSPGLALDNYIIMDSIRKRDGLQFASISDIEVEGSKYKLFLMPFRLNGKSLYLAGFIENQGYKLSVTSSSSWIFLLVLLLLSIVIIGLPVLKLFLLGKQENIVITDIRMLMVSLSVAPVFFLVILLTIKTYNSAKAVTTNMIIDFHSQVTRNFSGELDAMVDQMRRYDAIKDEVPPGILPDKRVDMAMLPTRYKVFENLSWADSSGWQTAKWTLNTSNSFQFLNIKERSYFQDIVENKSFRLNGDTLSVQPILSWSTGQYSINVSIPSSRTFKIKNGTVRRSKLITLGSTMYSVYNPVVAKAYNFCIVDKSGNILFHSEANRALHENLFDECYNNDDVRDAIAHQDTALIQSVNMYDGDVKMYITPLPGTNYYVVSYYNNREQNFYVYHVTAFSLLCVCGVLIVLLFFLYAYYLVSRKVSPLLFSPGESDWMKPSLAKIIYYKRLFVFLLSLVVLILLSALVIFVFCAAHWIILDIAVLSCFLAITGYYIIKMAHKFEVGAGQREARLSWLTVRKHSRVLIFFSGILLLLLLNILFDEKNRLFAIIPLIFSVMVLYAAYRISEVVDFPRIKLGYLQLYVSSVFLSVVLVSALPSVIFFKYAFDHELYLQVKSRQIFLAEKMAARNNVVDSAYKATKIYALHKSVDSALVQNISALANMEGDAEKKKRDSTAIDSLNRLRAFIKCEDSVYLDSLKYTAGFGIYTAFGDVAKDSFPTLLGKNKYGVDSFYKSVTKFLFLPTDHTDFFNNSSYHTWPDNGPNKDLIQFYYRENMYDSTDRTAIRIDSSVGKLKFYLFRDFFSTMTGCLLLISLVLFMIMLYRVISTLSKRVFLTNFSGDTSGIVPETKWLDTILANVRLGTTDEKNFTGRRYNEDAERVILTHGSLQEYEDRKMSAEQYIDILRMQDILSSSYDEIWKRCSERERFILYDFALDGFTNYKNPDLLYSLLKRGLLRVDRINGGLLLMTYSFRNYLISKSDSDEILMLKRNIAKGGTWKMIQNVFFLVILMILAYLVITQRELSTRIAAIISGLVTLLPTVIKLFDRRADGTDAKS